MKRGRPKGRTNDSSPSQSNSKKSKSFGPLGDLIRSGRLSLGLGLADVAKACQCSIQFVSNIEHGRAPLPWEKVGRLAQVLKLKPEEIQAANLSIRSEFRSFVTQPNQAKTKGAASALAFAAKDSELRELINSYQSASLKSRKQFVKAASEIFGKQA